eukprot:m.1032320 g.1032320  ORF g.1032320 m.1032320 type:complete len:405 (+) comp24123_c1_seq25:2967-4181(+)
MSDGADKELVGDQISDLRDQIERATQLVTKSNGTPDLTAVDFVERLLRSQGGSYRLAQLSKFLKNSAPPGIVAECLPIRRWLDANADSFEVVMEHGAYVVNLRPKRTVTSDAAKDSGDTCFGVDDWIYFRCTGEVANVVNGIRRALGQLIDRQIHRGPIGREGTLLVDTICDALVVTERAASTGAARPADAPPVSHQHLHGGRGRGSHEGRGRGGRESHGWRGRGRGGYGTRYVRSPRAYKVCFSCGLGATDCVAVVVCGRVRCPFVMPVCEASLRSNVFGCGDERKCLCVLSTELNPRRSHRQSPCPTTLRHPSGCTAIHPSPRTPPHCCHVRARTTRTARRRTRGRQHKWATPAQRTIPSMNSPGATSRAWSSHSRRHIRGCSMPPQKCPPTTRLRNPRPCQ